ncbi:MAG: hypothetical protein E7464_01990 [Ruminococcaceae bacterium]|nr:hypothetical protein [Oscillospiraceae bacterium]
MFLKRKTTPLWLFLSIMLLVLFLSGCGQQAVDVTVSATAYKAEDAAFQEACEVSFCGIYHESIFSADSYQGQIVIRNSTLTKPDDVTMELRFDGDIAIPTAKTDLGYQYTPQIHSVLRNPDTQSLVMVLYNDYVETEDTRTGSFDPNNPVFLCMGEISREDALKLISEKAL